MSDDSRIEAVARALCRSNSNYRTWHMPGDSPRKWKSPGGAVYDTSELPLKSAEILRNDARAALAAADAATQRYTHTRRESEEFVRGVPGHPDNDMGM